MIRRPRPRPAVRSLAPAVATALVMLAAGPAPASAMDLSSPCPQAGSPGAAERSVPVRWAETSAATDPPPKAGPPTAPAPAPAPAPAQPPAAAPPKPDSPAEPAQISAEQQKQIEDHRKQIERQRKQIEDQRKEIEAEKARLTDLQTKTEEQEALIKTLNEQLLLLTKRLEQLEDKLAVPGAPVKPEERLKFFESSVDYAPDLPEETIQPGFFPGSIRIPGTDAAFKIGGFVWASLIETLDPMGSDLQFLTYSIFVDKPSTAADAPKLSLWAGPTRVNFDYRTPTEIGEVRAFIEGDFAGTGNTFRLRHAYGQFKGWLAGQTWSTFADPEATVDDIDFEGLNAKNLVRQTQIRHTWYLKNRVRIATAIEYPNASITGGESLNQIPDLTGMIAKEFGKGHIQGAIVLRQIRGTADAAPGVVESAVAYGGTVSGVLPIKSMGFGLDRFVFQVNAGVGIATYIKDLNSAGGQDAFFDPDDNELRPLTAMGIWADYEHHWLAPGTYLGAVTHDLRSSFIAGYVEEWNQQGQPDTAYHRTYRLAANLVWSPVPRLDVGIEYLYGDRENKDEASGSARQIQMRAMFYF